MASKIKIKKFARTATETRADILERIGGSGGASYRSKSSKRPDYLKLKKQARPLQSSKPKPVVKKATHPKPKAKNQKKQLEKVAKVTGGSAVIGTSAAAGYAASQWINQDSDKKK